MPPLIHLVVDGERRCTLRALGDHDPGATLIQIVDDPVCVEGLVGDQGTEPHTLDQRRDADRIVAVARQQHEAHQIAECIDQGHDLGGQAAFRAADGLALCPPFAPWPWRWTLTMVPSTMAYSMSGSLDTASKIRLKTSALSQ